MSSQPQAHVELVDMAARQDLTYAVGFMKRYDPGIQFAQQAVANFVESGELGPLKMVGATCFLGDWLNNPGKPIESGEPPLVNDLEPTFPAFLSRDQRGIYDHFLNIYAHNVNLLHFLLPGGPMVCRSAHRGGQSFLVALRHEDVLVSLRGTPSHSHHWEEQTSLVFGGGRVEIRSATPLNRQQVAQVSIWREVAGVWSEQRLFPPVEWAFHQQAQAFVAAIVHGSDLPTSGDRCLADVLLMEDIFRKLQEG
ncbi:MAG: hypothetical protein U9R25_02145 [Chloroflexota bacterium]|nr:hypothetical protein [Chloroflexota bacterium]